jgi:hypothetical protein
MARPAWSRPGQRRPDCHQRTISTSRPESGSLQQPKHSTGILAGSSEAGSDEKVKVSANDTTPAYLIEKLVAGAGVALAETEDGSDETVTLRAAQALDETYVPFFGVRHRLR